MSSFIQFVLSFFFPFKLQQVSLPAFAFLVKPINAKGRPCRFLLLAESFWSPVILPSVGAAVDLVEKVGQRELRVDQNKSEERARSSIVLGPLGGPLLGGDSCAPLG